MEELFEQYVIPETFRICSMCEKNVYFFSNFRTARFLCRRCAYIIFKNETNSIEENKR